MMLVHVVLVLVCVFAVYILIPWGLKILLRRRFLAVIRRSGCVCLTFDDGPNPELTPRILEVLRAAGVKATFFLVGEKVEEYPELTRQIAQMGHEIGEHSYRHTHPWLTGPFRTAADLLRGGHVTEKYQSENRPVHFRPPYGKLNFVTLLYVWVKKRHPAFWDVNPKDYKRGSGEQVANFVIECLAPGSVILLHDGNGHSNSNSRSPVTAVALEHILNATVKRGVEFATIRQAESRSSKRSF